MGSPSKPRPLAQPDSHFGRNRRKYRAESQPKRLERRRGAKRAPTVSENRTGGVRGASERSRGVGVCTNLALFRVCPLCVLIRSEGRFGRVDACRTEGSVSEEALRVQIHAGHSSKALHRCVMHTRCHY